MARVRIDYDDRKLKKNVRRFDSNLKRAIAATVDRQAMVTTTWMKTNARWTDRTGAARTGIQATALHGPSYEEILMAYSVNYGIWLEVANDRQYAIILPAMRVMGDELMRSLEHVIDRMQNI